MSQTVTRPALPVESGPNPLLRPFLIPPGRPKSFDQNKATSNYTGLISTIYKLFHVILNECLSEYIELKKTLVDKQNGFRKNRAYIDHICVLFSVVEARL